MDIETPILHWAHRGLSILILDYNRAALRVVFDAFLAEMTLQGEKNARACRRNGEERLTWPDSGGRIMFETTLLFHTLPKDVELRFDIVVLHPQILADREPRLTAQLAKIRPTPASRQTEPDFMTLPERFRPHH